MIFKGIREVYNKINDFWDGRDSVQTGGYATLLGETCSFHIQDRKLLQP